MSQKIFFYISYIFIAFGASTLLIEHAFAASSGKSNSDISSKIISSWWTIQSNENKDNDESRESEKKESGSNSIEEDISSPESESNKEEKKIKQDINAYIIDSYKAQGSKIVKDLSVKLTKTIPDEKDRQEAYSKIRTSLELRLDKTERLKMSDTKKLILKEFLTHMIDLLDKKIAELR
jgi:hypothetical protein